MEPQNTSSSKHVFPHKIEEMEMYMLMELMNNVLNEKSAQMSIF